VSVQKTAQNGGTQPEHGASCPARAATVNTRLVGPKRDDPYFGFTFPERFNPEALITVYVIASGGADDLVKIGVSRDLRRRLLSFEAGNPHGITLLAKRETPYALGFQVERQVHEELAEHAHGREWFRAPLATVLPVVDRWHRRARAAMKWRLRLEGEPGGTMIGTNFTPHGRTRALSVIRP
jgi:hypothetical protein